MDEINNNDILKRKEESFNKEKQQQFIYKPIPIKLERILNNNNINEITPQNLLLSQLNVRRMSAPATLFPENYEFLQQTQKV